MDIDDIQAIKRKRIESTNELTIKKINHIIYCTI